MIYRRDNNRLIWHWFQECPDWPVTKFAEFKTTGVNHPTTGKLCDACFAIRRELREQGYGHECDYPE